jgi:hypothetical protein
MLIAGAGRDAERVAHHIVSQRASRRVTATAAPPVAEQVVS